MGNFLTTAKDSIIFTAKKDQTVTLNLWNRSEGTEPQSGWVQGLNVRSSTEVFNDNDIMDNAAPNEHPDTVHEIYLKSGQSIYAWCSKDNTIEYKVE